MRGYAAALASLVRLHDQPSLAADIARNDGLMLIHFVKARTDDFDLEPLRRALGGR